MRNELLGLVGALASGAGLALGQGIMPPPPMMGGSAPQMGAAAAPYVAPVPAGAYEGPMYASGPNSVYSDVPQRTWSFYITGEYLLWDVDTPQLAAPLVTTGNTQNLATLGVPGTVVIGGTDLDPGTFSGLRARAGVWLNASKTWAIEGEGVLLGQKSVGIRAASDTTGTPVLGRPFFDTTIGGENVRTISFPQAFTGSVDVNYSTIFWTAEGSVVQKLTSEGSDFQSAMLYGFKHANLFDRLDVKDSSTILPRGVASFNGNGLLAPGATGAFDYFSTRVQFYGAQIGNRMEYRMGNLVIGGVGKLAVGGTRNTGSFNGTSAVAGPSEGGFFQPIGVPGGGVPFATLRGSSLPIFVRVPTVGIAQTGGGLLVPANQRVADTEFSFAPEFGINLGYTFADFCTISLGYNFLYISNVARSPSQVANRFVNPTLLPTASNFGVNAAPAQQPALLFNDSVTIQGLTAGVTLTW